MQSPAEPALKIDRRVGENVQKARLAMGLSQSSLARALGISFQQLQKYESGKNRIAASRLHAIGEVLQRPMSFFFNGEEDGGAAPRGSPEVDEMTLAKREVMVLVSTYLKIKDSRTREMVRNLVSTLAKAS